MIGYLRGVIMSCSEGVATVLNLGSGIGYEVHCSNVIPPNTSYDFWTHEHAPQDAPHELYGFEKREDRDLFRRLLNIKGVGPKVAQRVVAENLPDSRSSDFVTRLTKIRGVGATLAQRIAEEMT